MNDNTAAFYYVWPDGSYCEQEEYNEADYSSRSDDFQVVIVTKWDDTGEPIFEM